MLIAIAPTLLALLLVSNPKNTPQETPLSVPAFTAYSHPNPEAVQFSEEKGILGWTESKQKIIWYGKLKQAGSLEITLRVHLPNTSKVTYRMRVANQTLLATVEGGPTSQNLVVPLRSVTIKRPGYYAFVLEGLKKEGQTFGDISALELSGEASKNAHFSRVERRNAASVHLSYPLEKEAKVAQFYAEITPRTDPLWSYYMACGFHRGYFGIQVNSPTERRIIFSVWDSGNEAVDRNRVGKADRVAMLEKGEGVVTDDFGNEGTGGHSHLIYPWKKNQTYRFLLRAEPLGDKTLYSAYFYFPEKESWGLIAKFRAPKDGSFMRGLYSFNENFSGANGDLRRLAEFGNQWVQLSGGEWQELTKARFSHDSHGKEERKDYMGGALRDRFYLSNGGFLEGNVRGGDTFQRVPTHQKPLNTP